MTTSGVVIAWRRPETDIVISSHVRKSKVVLDSTFNTIDSGFLETGFRTLSVELGFRIPRRKIPDSTSKNVSDSGFHKKNFHILGNRIPLQSKDT